MNGLANVLDFYGIRYSNRHGNQKILCPVHEDHSPSASLHLDKGVWQCWGCGAAGNALVLIALKEGITNQQARAFAADNGIALGDDQEGDGEVRINPLSGRRLPGGSRDKRGQRKFHASWLRS